MNEPLRRLHVLGQSICYDNIRRVLLDSGGLLEYVDEFAVTGVTSSPSIFAHANAGSSDYDGGLRDALEPSPENDSASRHSRAPRRLETFRRSWIVAAGQAACGSKTCDSRPCTAARRPARRSSGMPHE